MLYNVPLYKVRGGGGDGQARGCDAVAQPLPGENRIPLQRPGCLLPRPLSPPMPNSLEAPRDLAASPASYSQSPPSPSLVIPDLCPALTWPPGTAIWGLHTGLD